MENKEVSELDSGIRDVSYTFASKVFIIITSLGSQSLLAWILGPEERGAYAVALLFCMLLGLIFVIGCDYAGIYYLASKEIDVSGVVVNTFIFGIIGSIVAIGFGFLLFQIPLSFLQKASQSDFYLALVLIPFHILSQTIVMLISAKSNFKWFAFMSSLNGLLQLVFITLFIFIFPLGVNGALYAHILTGILTLIAGLSYFYKYHNLKFRSPDFNSLKKMFTFDFKHYIGKLSNQVNLEIGTIILAFFATKEEIGLFAVAVTLTTRFNMIPDTLSVVLIPKVASDSGGRQNAVATGARITGVVCGVLLMLVFLFADLIVNILFSQAFQGAIILIRILCFGVLIRCYSKILVTYLLGTNRPGIVSWSVGIGTVLNLFLLWFLLPLIGISAAAISMSISFTVSSIIIIIMFHSLSTVKLEQMFLPGKSDYEIVRSMYKKFI